MNIEQLESRWLFSAGQVDTSFGTNGRVLTGLSDTRLGINDAALMKDGRVVAAGFATLKGQLSAYSIARYNEDGLLDRTFGGSGIITWPVNGKLLDVHVAASESGEIVVAALVQQHDIRSELTSFRADGTLNTSFGIEGSSGSSIYVRDDRAQRRDHHRGFARQFLRSLQH
jgi:hypothetical protein